MKSGLRVASPPSKPLMIFDGDCRFCGLWIERWRCATAGHVDFLPFQEPQVAARFADVPRAALEEEAHLIGPDGTVSKGAEAVFRSLAYNPHEKWLLDWYEHSPTFVQLTEGAYRFVARHRRFFSFLTRLGWGNQVGSPSHTLFRAVFLRSLGVIYLIAFVSLWVQVSGLLGNNGIMPTKLTMELARQQFTNAHIELGRYHLFPTLCWFGSGENALTIQCAAGTALALLLIIGIAPAPCLFLLWLIYLSLVTVGSDFLSFQWDSLLLEVGFLAVFFAPIALLRRVARAREPSKLVLWLFRWLTFRLMFESGWVKLLSGDPTWRHLAALNYHYETQPLPTWIGWYAFQLPARVQKASTLLMFAIELLLPLLIFLPRRPRQLACAGFVLLQVSILLTGNYCFFNLLTIALSLSLLDDAALRAVLRFPFRSRQQETEKCPDRGSTPLPFGSAPRTWAWPQRFVRVPLAVVIVTISTMQLVSMFGLQASWPRPLLGLYRWVAPFRSINHYGLFAVMTTSRSEIIVEGSNDGVKWLPYEFKYKPGLLNRRPSFVEPHQPRLDWQMWFAALSSYQQNPWFINFCGRLLSGSPEVLALLEHNPFPDAPPMYIRAQAYDYHFTDMKTRGATGDWWRREPTGPYMPAISLRREPASESQP